MEDIITHVSILEAARFLGVSDQALRVWIKKGHVFSCKINGKMKIPVSEVKMLIQRYGAPCRPNFNKVDKEDV